MNAPTQLDVVSWIAPREEIAVVPLIDPVVEAHGHDPRSAYAEAFWLPILGPSSLLAARTLAAGLERAPGGFRLPLAPFAAQLGLGQGTGRHSPAVRTLARLVAFDMAAIRGDTYAARRAFAPLTRRHVARLPVHLAELHRREIDSTVVPLRA